MDSSSRLSLLAWFFAGIGVFGVIGLLNALTQQAGAETAQFQLYLVVNSATAGAGVGLLVGVYDWRTRRRDAAVLGLHAVTQDLLETSTREEACQVTANAAESILELPLTGLWLRAGDRLVPAAMSPGARESFEDYPTFDRGESLAWDVYESQEPQLVTDLAERSSVHNPDTDVRSEYIVPIGDHGVMISGSLTDRTFTALQRDLSRLIAAHTELVLDRNQRTHRLQNRERQLREQNEKLEQFTAVVSHDLRNPLNVIDGYLEIVRETYPSEDFDEIRTAVDRMDALLTDLLSLARTGEEIDDTEPVRLETIAVAAAENVGLSDLDVVVDADAVVHADESRAVQLFENLFRNAVEHADGASRITVEATETGFAVEDDGPGIPADERERVFEYGYTDAEDGTGLGLAIVSEIAAGHGWAIDIETGSTGGARFEFSDVD